MINKQLLFGWQNKITRFCWHPMLLFTSPFHVAADGIREWKGNGLIVENRFYCVA
jgi:hypothetical protein